MNETLKAVRNKVIAAVPEIVERTHVPTLVKERQIQLSDVLRAINKSLEGTDFQLAVEHTGLFTGDFFDWEGSDVYFWNLSLDLDRQSPEVWAFLDRVLK